MKVEQISGKEERRILIGMIVDTVVLGRVASRWKNGMFRSKWANVVGEFCIQHYARYGKAPKQSIEVLFEAWSEKAQDKETIALAERFISSLSEQYAEQREKINRAHLVDLAAKHFNRVRLSKLSERIQAKLDVGDVDAAAQCVADFGAVDLNVSPAIDVLSDKSALVRAFAERKEPLIELPGDLGRFFGRALCREGFIAFLGPEKIGKTTWLVYLAWQAMLQRKRVAFFACGDESEEEMMLRFSQLAARRPLHAGMVKIPIEIEKDGRDSIVTYRDCVFGKPLSPRLAYHAFNDTKESKLKSTDEYLRLSVHPNSTLSVAMIDTQLADWAREGWVADVVVVDYMDILLESGAGARDDIRHRINATWKEMRRLSQVRHALVLTATQANAASYEGHLITRKNFAEDKRKLAHVTGMVGLNQTDVEKKQQVTRLNWVVGRGFGYSTNRCVRCAGAFAVAHPAIKTLF